MTRTVVALTGVPGTGKTTIAHALRPRATVLHLNEVARDAGLLTDEDEARAGTFIVDVDALADVVNAHLAGFKDVAILEGHFAHEMDVDRIVLLRCDPLVLHERLRARGWPDAKVRENVEAEALDVLAQEVLDAEIPAVELDATHLSVDEAARRVWGIAESGPEALKGDPVGTARWALESLPWY